MYSVTPPRSSTRAPRKKRPNSPQVLHQGTTKKATENTVTPIEKISPRQLFAETMYEIQKTLLGYPRDGEEPGYVGGLDQLMPGVGEKFLAPEIAPEFPPGPPKLVNKCLVHPAEDNCVDPRKGEQVSPEQRGFVQR